MVANTEFDEIRADEMLGSRPAIDFAARLRLRRPSLVGVSDNIAPDCGRSSGADARKDRALRHLIRNLLLTSVTLVLAMSALAVPASAQTRLEARYSATIAGIPIGTGSWGIDVADAQYSAAVSGTTSGLLRAFTGGQGTATARGTLSGGRLASIYAANMTGRNNKKFNSIRITISNGNVKDYKVDPPVDNDPDRVPITEASQRGVLDPMTAALVRMPGNGDLLVPEACNRTQEIFDGRLRYDMQFSFKRMDKVKAAKGYSGPVVVCSHTSYRWPALSRRAQPLDISPSSATWKFGWRRSLEPVCWCLIARRGRRRSVRQFSKHQNSFQFRSKRAPRPMVRRRNKPLTRRKAR